jgi:TolA-binding protein
MMMRKNLKKAGLSFIAGMLMACPSMGQETAIYSQPGFDYRLATEMFHKKQYGNARQIFDRLLREPGLINDEILPDVELYDAISATELTNADGPGKVSDFVADHPENSLRGEASFYLGRNYFNDNKYKDAIRALQQVDASELSRESREELNFMLGYAQLKSDNIAAAKGNFQRITNAKSPYFGQAKYFLAHIDYLQGNYPQALKAFEQLENDKRYQKIIPMYKIQIYHYMGENEKIMTLGPEMVESSSTTNKAEVARITANAFFNAGDFEKAAYYMDIFERTSRKTFSRDDQYLMGFVAYLGKDYKGAINNFQGAIKENDALSQNAYYYLGACYNETGQKKYAANAFLAASKGKFDQEIADEALFNYVKISLETPANPYNEAISLLESYLRDNPGSPRTDEAYGYLSQLYLSSRNYKQALVSIESIGEKNPGLDAAYQKILFYRAGELFNANDMDGALSLYRKASQMTRDESVKAAALYWSGEIAYRQGNYPSAIKYYKDFLASRQAKSLPEYSYAYYNLGYCYFNSEDFTGAISNFTKFLESGQVMDKSLTVDARLRLGDAYFISNQYEKAIASYDKVITAREGPADYAIYYKALSEGAKGNFPGKIDAMKALVNNYPKSGYVDDALYETALAYILLNQESQALTWFDRLIREFPSSSKATQAWLRKGFIYYNRDDNNQAISSFKHVIEKFPGTTESQEALAALKNIYVETGQVDQYYAYARNLSFGAVDVTEEDSLNYQVAENLYTSNQCDKAIAAFGRYLEKFPDGAFASNALYYQGECNMKANRRSDALENFRGVATRPRSRFTEPALARASAMEYTAGNYAAALPLYEQLETVAEEQANLTASLVGQMRCHLREKNYVSAAGAARKVLESPGIPQDAATEAHFCLGHAFLAEDNLAEASAEFLTVSKLKGTEIGADATYQLAWIAFQTDKTAETEDLVYSLSENFSAFDYWVAKGFILLSDVFVKNGNTFQAKQTLQSVIENYSGPELGEIAREKLAALEVN